MVRMAYTPNPVISRSKEARGCLNATTKGYKEPFPFKLNTGADCTDWRPRSMYRRRQPGIKTSIRSATSGQTTILFLTRRLPAQVPDIGRG